MDLIKAIAKDQGFEIEITNPGFDAAISAVQAGQADGIIAGMSVTDARKATFDFSESYYTANTILGVKESSTIASYEDLKGKTVGVKNGTAFSNLPNRKSKQIRLQNQKPSLMVHPCMTVKHWAIDALWMMSLFSNILSVKDKN